MKLRNVVLSLVASSLLFSGMALAQVGFGVEWGRRPRAEVVIVEQPTCVYGYYDYEPYACAPYGFYGDGYFYNGIFLGVGPWANWGYEHGWGGHRFNGGHGGSYRGNGRGNGRGEGRGDGRGRGGNRGHGNGGHRH